MSYFARQKCWEVLQRSVIGYSSMGEWDNTHVGEMTRSLDIVMKTVNFIESYLRRHQAQTTNSKLLWITARPPDGWCSEMKLLEIASIICRKNYVKEYCFVLEQTGENHESAGQGKHFHMLIRFANRIDAVKRMIADLLPGTKVHYENCREEFVEDKILYMLGYKRGEKLEKVVNDRWWRQEHLIQDLYLEGFVMPAWPDGSVAWTEKPDQEEQSIL